MRKTTFKTLVDAYIGQMLWLEVMEWKERMREKKHTKEFGVKASCVMRGVKHLEEFDLTLPSSLKNLELYAQERLHSQKSFQAILTCLMW